MPDPVRSRSWTAARRAVRTDDNFGGSPVLCWRARRSWSWPTDHQHARGGRSVRPTLWRSECLGPDVAGVAGGMTRSGPPIGTVLLDRLGIFRSAVTAARATTHRGSPVRRAHRRRSCAVELKSRLAVLPCGWPEAARPNRSGDGGVVADVAAVTARLGRYGVPPGGDGLPSRQGETSATVYRGGPGFARDVASGGFPCAARS